MLRILLIYLAFSIGSIVGTLLLEFIGTIAKTLFLKALGAIYGDSN